MIRIASLGGYFKHRVEMGIWAFSSQWPGTFKDGEGHWQDARQEPILNTNPFTWKSNDVAVGKID